MTPPPARVEGVSSTGKPLRKFPDLSGRCADCALQQARDFSRTLPSAHQLDARTKVGILGRRAPRYAPWLARDTICSRRSASWPTTAHVADMAGRRGSRSSSSSELKLRDFASGNRLRVCHCEVKKRRMDLWMTPLYSYAHGEQIL